MTVASTDASSGSGQSGEGSNDFQTMLSVSGNSIDTGRYVVTGMNSYTRDSAYGGGAVDDGEVRVFDKRSSTYVDVFGDPHVTDSAGDKAKFAVKTVQLNLADGSTVQFLPTGASNGVAYIGGAAVTKNGQTSFVNGVYNGTVQVSGPQQGSAASLDGSYASGNTVALTAGGSLSTLLFSDGTQLDSKQTDLDLDAWQPDPNSARGQADKGTQDALYSLHAFAQQCMADQVALGREQTLDSLMNAEAKAYKVN